MEDFGSFEHASGSGCNEVKVGNGGFEPLLHVAEEESGFGEFDASCTESGSCHIVGRMLVYESMGALKRCMMVFKKEKCGQSCSLLLL